MDQFPFSVFQTEDGIDEVLDEAMEEFEVHQHETTRLQNDSKTDEVMTSLLN